MNTRCFMAYSASLRSADLSRQIGAAICNNNEVLAMGANDCPKFNGGLYWPLYDESEEEYIDIDCGRDYKLGYDSNKKEFRSIAEDVLNNLVNN